MVILILYLKLKYLLFISTIFIGCSNWTLCNLDFLRVGSLSIITFYFFLNVGLTLTMKQIKLNLTYCYHGLSKRSHSFCVDSTDKSPLRLVNINQHKLL